MIANCRISQKPLIPVLDLGIQPLGNGFLKQEQFSDEYKYHMQAGFCEESKLFQLIKQPDPSIMFHENYAFFSGTSKLMTKHFSDLAGKLLKSPYLAASDRLVIELGSNDGILLKHFAAHGINHIGIEPSTNVADVARSQGINVVTEFFSSSLADRLVSSHGQVDLFMAANVMCHIPAMDDVIQGIAKLLKPSGAVVFEDPYLGDVIAKTSYDQIYDEHVFLFSCLSVRHMFARHGLELFHAEHLDTHGGSMRYFICHKGAYELTDQLQTILTKEIANGLDCVESMISFSRNVKLSKTRLLDLLHQLKKSGSTLSGYAATSKSTTILNYCQIGKDLIPYIFDTTPLKQGLFSPGMHIPVIPDSDFERLSTEYTINFAWNHSREILQAKSDYTLRGGKWITHVPDPKVLT